MVGSDKENRPLIAITMGDPAGIGPEIALKALSRQDVYNVCKPVLIGDISILQKTSALLEGSVSIRSIDDVTRGFYKGGTIEVVDIGTISDGQVQSGKISKVAGDAAFQAVKKAIDLALSKQVAAIVTGPINKESLNLAGHHFAGHTEILAHFTGSKKYAMLLVNGNFRVIHVSTHVSLREACDRVKKDRILEVIQLLNNACRQFGVEKPRLGIAGLNPHAGDGGLFGDEEINEIIPAIEQAKKLGFAVEGPVPADALFAKAKGGVYDGCVAMYHDQGHIPFKTEGFVWDADQQQMRSVQGVNITLGLPIIRTSVDHGTAFDIAGKGIASPDAMIAAIEYAALMARSRPVVT